MSLTAICLHNDLCSESRFDYRTDNKKKNLAAIFTSPHFDLSPFKIRGQKRNIQTKGTRTRDKEARVRTQASHFWIYVQ